MRLLASSILRRKHQDIFPGALAKLYHVLLPELKISTWGDFLRVERGAVGAFEVDEVRLDLSNLITILVTLLDIAELDDGMLLAHAGVFGGHVDDGHIPADKPATTMTQRDGVDDVLPLEDEQPPLVLERRLPSFWGFMVFQHDGGTVRLCDRVGSGGKGAGVAVVRLLLGLGRLFAVSQGKGVGLRGQRPTALEDLFATLVLVVGVMVVVARPMAAIAPVAVAVIVA